MPEANFLILTHVRDQLIDLETPLSHVYLSVLFYCWMSASDIDVWLIHRCTVEPLTFHATVCMCVIRCSFLPGAASRLAD